jgi:hypothetical protein
MPGLVQETLNKALEIDSQRKDPIKIDLGSGSDEGMP